MDFKSAFSGFSVDDLKKAKQFYGETLGLNIAADESMGLDVSLPGGSKLFIYQKDDHQPASYTVLNFVTDNIGAAVDTMTANGVVFEQYDNMPGQQEENGILRGKAANMGPDIAWFKDPAGNILAVLEQ